MNTRSRCNQFFGPDHDPQSGQYSNHYTVQTTHQTFRTLPPRKDISHKPAYPYAPLPKESDPPTQPADHFAYLRLLGILLYLAKSRPDIMAAVSFAGTKSSNPTDRDLSDLYYVVNYLRSTQEMGHILHTSTLFALRLYCEVDASYLLHPNSKGHTWLFNLILRVERNLPQPLRLSRQPSPPRPFMQKPGQYLPS
jgi:hypothetical protein